MRILFGTLQDVVVKILTGVLLGIVLRRSVIESGVRKNSGECPFTKRG